MTTLVSTGLANAAAAAVLVLLAAAAGRFSKRPALVHSLWVLVLIKLVTPPFFQLPIASLPAPGPLAAEAAPPSPAHVAGVPLPAGEVVFPGDFDLAVPPGMVPFAVAIAPDLPPDVQQALLDALPPGEFPPLGSPAETASVGTPSAVDPAAQPWRWDPARYLSWAGAVWLAGSALCFGWLALQLARFHRLLRHARPAPAGLQEQARCLAAQMGLPRCPAVRLLPGRLPPLVWALTGRARVFFPEGLLDRLGAEAVNSLLAHELAHLRRRDHWVRWLEVLAGGLYWWYPLVWLTRRRIQAYEEECCDAWAVDEVSARTYAEAVLETVDFLAERKTGLPALCSGFNHFRQLKGRLTKIMERSTPKRLSPAGWLAVLALAVLSLPLVPVLAQPDPADAGPKRPADAAPAQPKADAEEEPTVFGPAPATLGGNPTEVMALDISRDGRLLAAATGYWKEPGAITVWELGSRKELMTFPEAQGVASVAFSPDGRLLAWSGWDRQVRLIDVATRREVQVIPLEGVARLAFAPDGRTLATASEANGLRIWDVATGKETTVLEGGRLRFLCVAYSPDGKLLAAGGGDFQEGGVCQVNVWDVTTGKQLHELKGHSQAVITVAFAPDGKSLATGGWDSVVKLWDVQTGKPRVELPGHKDGRVRLAFSPDGKLLATGGGEGGLKLWDVATGKEQAGWTGHARRVRAVVFSPDGKHLATGGTDATVKLWDVGQRQEVAAFQRGQGGVGPAAAVIALAGSPDGKVLAVATDAQTAELRDRTTGKVLTIFKGHTDTVTCLAFAPDGKTLATGSPDRTVKLWAPATGQERLTLKGHTSWVYAIAFAPDGKTLASAGYDKTIRLWDATTGQERAVFKGHTASVRALAFAPDGQVLASGSGDRTVRLWDVTALREQAVLKGHQGTVRAVGFSPDGKALATAGEDGAVKVWNPATGVERFNLQGHTGEVWSLAFSPRGKTLATGGADHTVRLWDPAAGQPRATLKGHSDGVAALTFAPDGRQLITGSHDKTVRLWSAATPRPAGAFLPGPRGPIWLAVYTSEYKWPAWGADDRMVRRDDLARGDVRVEMKVIALPPMPLSQTAGRANGPEGAVVLWNTMSRKERTVLLMYRDVAYSVTFSRDGRPPAGAGLDETMLLVPVLMDRPAATPRKEP